MREPELNLFAGKCKEPQDVAEYGVPIATEKKQRTWPEGPVPPCFAFSKPVSEGLIRELAFKNGYRESRAREITRSHPKVLRLLDHLRLGEPSPGKIVVFSPLLSEAHLDSCLTSLLRLRDDVIVGDEQVVPNQEARTHPVGADDSGHGTGPLQADFQKADGQ
jgi:hypothetical protein